MTGVLLSGGMDSIAVAYWRRPSVAFTVDYGQVSAVGEINAASAVAEALGIDHHLIRIDLRSLGSGDLAGTAPLSIAPIPEWWPFRNQMLVTLAAMQGIKLGVDRLLIGAVKSDSQHADGTEAFIDQFDTLLRMQEGSIALDAPAIHLTSAELLRASRVPREVLGWAHSCHVSAYACGMCRGCRKHYETLEQIGVSPY